MTELLFEQVSSFSGNYPAIETRAGFKADENDSAPFYVTLPLGKAGNLSENGRLYDREFYAELVGQVNHATPDNPVVGIVGHSDPLGAGWKVDMPAIEWVGATLESDGMAWGKFYVYPEETKLRGTIRRAIRNGAKVATSIWGLAKMEGNRATKPTIKRIDYADPERAGVKAAVAVPVLTSEMTENGENKVSETDNTLLITELRNDRDSARTALSEMQTQFTELQAKYNALAPKLEKLQELAGNQELVAYFSELANEIKLMRAAKLQLEVNALIAEQVKLEVARPLIQTMLGVVDSKEAAQSRLKELLETETVKMTLQSLALSAAGGHLAIGEHKDSKLTLDESPEAVARAKSFYGIG